MRFAGENLSVGQSYGVVDLPDHLGPGARRLSHETKVFRDRIDAVGDRETVLNHRQHIHHSLTSTRSCTASHNASTSHIRTIN